MKHIKILIACIFLFACKSKPKEQIDLLVFGSDTVEIRGAESMNLSKTHGAHGYWLNDSVFCTEIKNSFVTIRDTWKSHLNDSILLMQTFGGAVPARPNWQFSRPY